MKIGLALFIVGLLIYMLGIYLSAFIGSIGTVLGVGGGMMLGVSSYFIGKIQVKSK
jgi:hypothetical protein